MEARGQDKDADMPNSLSFNPARPNQKASFDLSSIVSTVTDRRRNETLDHYHLHHDQQQLQLNLQKQIQKPGRDPNPDPDPVLAASATISDASNSKTAIPPQPPPQATTLATNITVSIQYRECLKNHAASMGAHVLDGCGEFMPSGEEGTPVALKCAACDCHRNFHRKEAYDETQPTANFYYTYNPNRNSSQRTIIHSAQAPPLLPPPTSQHHHKYSHGYFQDPINPRAMMSFGGNCGAPAESSSEDLNMFHSINEGELQLAQPSFSRSKKRFRTKFSQEQKDSMQEFAEKLEWKIEKQDEAEVQQFCTEVGVKRKAFKVWMNNNKQAMKKKQL